MIDYSKNLEQINVLQQSEIETKDMAIQKLTTENDSFKNNKELIKRDNLIKEQKSTIKNLKKENSKLKELVNTLEIKFNKEKEKWKKLFNKMCNAIDKVLKREPKKYVEDYEDLADSIINDNYDYGKNKEKEKKDYEIGI